MAYVADSADGYVVGEELEEDGEWPGAWEPDFTIYNDGWLSHRKDGGRRDDALPGRRPESDKRPSTLNDHNYTIMQPRIDHKTTTILQQETSPPTAKKAEDLRLRTSTDP
ncbi:hypothetical protein [Tunturibacter empetritectus]|uniref:Uncharacterized protein n=1 Tax=Tunturiibacter lichenicola TaxID=2051959 RepID=A0A7W8J4L3_9BACT|nr:hypothetical protein [Edaphobacter lichenicola]MBB5342533.1 hypothetical protein [Edaphobacter lichenicola]